MSSYQILSQEEADAQAIPYSPWRQVHPSEWALTDDGFVGVCLVLQEFTEKNGRIRRLFTFPFGRIWDSPKVRLDFMERYEVGNWSATSAKSWLEIEAKRSRTKTAVSLYVRQILTNGKPDYDALGKVYRPDQRIPAATFRRLLHHGRIQQMIEDEKTRVFNRNGLSLPEILQEYNSLIHAAKEKKDMKTYRLVLATMLQLHGILPKKGSRDLR